jgi:hypothetical protein
MISNNVYHVLGTMSPCQCELRSHILGAKLIPLLPISKINLEEMVFVINIEERNAM